MKNDLNKTGLLLSHGRQQAGNDPLMALLMLQSAMNQPKESGVPSFVNPWRFEEPADAIRRLMGTEFSPNQTVDEDFRALRQR